MSASYELGSVFRVAILGDRALLLAFKEWAIASRIYSLGGVGSCGADWMVDFFVIDHRAAITAWFESQRVARCKGGS